MRTDPEPFDSAPQLEELYEELHRLAHRELAARPSQTLQTTALVNEAYVRLFKRDGAEWESRAHFLGCAAKAMRSVLVDYARRRSAARRGEGVRPLRLEDVRPVDGSDPDDAIQVLAVHEALQRLERSHPDLAALAEARFFGGLTVVETAELMKVSQKKVKLASAYLRSYLS